MKCKNNCISQKKKNKQIKEHKEIMLNILVLIESHNDKAGTYLSLSTEIKPEGECSQTTPEYQ